MPELVIVSGKGGTGKTSITGCLAVLADNPIIVDCDVDAANLHLILKPAIEQTKQFYGGVKAVLDFNKCIQCANCVQHCQFKAISEYIIDIMDCEGCGVCHYVCPVGAIELHNHISGEYYISESPYGFMVHAKLGIAEGNSGKLVAAIKNEARHARHSKEDLILVDGPPGIGCPVISSLSGADYALIITEPTVSGMHDMSRIIELVKQLQVKAAVCINKCDLSERITHEIIDLCNKSGIPIIGQLKYDRVFLDAIYHTVPVVVYDADSQASHDIKKMWKNLKQLMS